MRIYKTIKGEKLIYYVHFIPKEMKAKVRYFLGDEPIICEISSDFKYIILPDSFLSPYISGHGRIPVGKIKLNRAAQIEAKDYASIL